jgi:hypothetical protein
VAHQTSKQDAQAAAIDASGVLVVLHNPRYAGLTATEGEIVGRGRSEAHRGVPAVLCRQVREMQGVAALQHGPSGS